MPQGRKVQSRALTAALAALLCWLPTPATAQPTGGDAGRVRVPAPPPSDFMLGRPRVFVTFDSGFLFANTGSDLYDFITSQLTIDKKSFNTPVLGGRLGVSITPRVDVMVGLEFGKSNTASEYRDFVDNQLLPIAQTTTRSEYNVTGSVRWALLPSGRRISRFAWVPRMLGHAKRLIRRPDGSRAQRTLPVRLYSERVVVCAMGSNWLSTKSRYSEAVFDLPNSSPTITSTRGVIETPIRPPSTGVLNDFLSIVNCEVMKS